MNGSRIAKLGVLILAALIISILVTHTGDRDQAEASSFGLINPAVLSDLSTSAPADLTTAFTLPQPDANFAGVVTFLPPEFTLSTTVPIGDTVGELRSISSLGFFLGSVGIGACGGAGTPVNFRLDVGAVDPLVDGIVVPLPAGASARMQPMFDDDGDFNNNGNLLDAGDPYFEQGNIIIDSERMLITDIDTIGNTLTVVRGVAGTTPDTHTNTTGIFIVRDANIDSGADLAEDLDASETLIDVTDASVFTASGPNRIPDGLDRVPTFYTSLFNFDNDPSPGDGNDNVDANEIPFTRATGFTFVSTETVMLSLITFDKGQLLNAPTSPGNTFVTEMGYPAVVVLTPPDPTVPLSPSPVTDFCSPVRTATTTCGQTDPSGFDEQEAFSFGCSTTSADHRYDRTNSEDGAGTGTCSDGTDNAPDGRRDFDDPDCYVALPPFEVYDPANDEKGAGINTCSDGVDNGGGGADQADSDCYDAFPGTDHKYLHAFVEDATLPGANDPPTCSDGLDNTNDGKRDFEDRDCYDVVKSLSDGTQIQGPAVLYDPTNSEDGGAANSCSDGADNGGGDEDADGADNIDQDDKDCYAGAGNASVAVRNNPSSGGTYALLSWAISGRDFDNDGLDAGLDACPQTADNDGDGKPEDLADDNRNGINDGKDAFDAGDLSWDDTPWDPRVDGAAVGDSDFDGLPNGCDPTPGFNTGFVGDHDGDGFKNTQDNCETVPNPTNTAGSVTPSVDPGKSALDIPLGFQAPDLGPLSDGIGAACDDSDNDGSEDGAGPGTCNDGIDNSVIPDGAADGNDLDCSANEGTGSPTVDGTCDDGLDNNGGGLIDGLDPLCQGPQTGGGADDTGVDLVDTDDDQDSILDTADDTPAIPSGHFHSTMSQSAICIGLTDSDGDGWCDADEIILGSDKDVNPAEQGADCDNAADNDGDGVVNDGCPVRGLLAEAGSQCTEAVGFATSDDTPSEDIAETILQLPAGEGINDGCPPVYSGSTPETYNFVFNILPAVTQICDDGIDQDDDGVTDECTIDDPDGDSNLLGDPQGRFLRTDVENFLGTNPLTTCAVDTITDNEAVDATGTDWDDDRDSDGSDVFLFAQRFGTKLGVPPPVGKLPYLPRFDIFPDFASAPATGSRDEIDGSDVFVLATYFGKVSKSCP